MRIVLADDSKPTRDFLARVIVEAGHQVAGEARDGQEAVTLCIRFKPDVLFIDQTMPKLHGDIAARTVLEGKFAREVVMISLDAKSKAFSHVRAMGVEVLAKPCSAPQIEKVLRELQLKLS